MPMASNESGSMTAGRRESVQVDARVNDARRNGRTELVKNAVRNEDVVIDAHAREWSNRRIDVLQYRTSELSRDLENRLVPRFVHVAPVMDMYDVRPEPAEYTSHKMMGIGFWHDIDRHPLVRTMGRQGGCHNRHFEAVPKMVVEIDDKLRRASDPDIRDRMQNPRPACKSEPLAWLNSIDGGREKTKCAPQMSGEGGNVDLAHEDEPFAAKTQILDPAAGLAPMQD